MKMRLIICVLLIVAWNAAADSGVKMQAEHGDPVNFAVELPEEITRGGEYTAKVLFSFMEGWHGYSGDPANVALGFVPTTVEFVFPDKIVIKDMEMSSESAVYKGDDISFSQKFTCPKKGMKKGDLLKVVIKLQWQVCNDNMCLPPRNVTIERTIRVL